MNKPVFSVVIPTYNRAEKLLRCLESLNQQTFLNFEVLVCDDGSTDDTKLMIDDFRSRKQFLSLYYFYQENSGGPARPRNTGISHASADWICFLDSDDYWYPEKLQLMLPHLPDYDVLYHDFDLTDNSGRRKKIISRQLKNPVFQDLMLNGHNGCIINSGACVKREILERVGGVNEDPLLVGVEDADLWLKVSRITNRFKHISVQMGMYFLDGGNITTYDQKMYDKLQYLFHLHASCLPNESKRDMAGRTNNYHLARIKQSMGQPDQARKLFYSSLRAPTFKLAMRSACWLLFLYTKDILQTRESDHSAG
jgi:glycosyltransferase involved in cell wall biosynthesis